MEFMKFANLIKTAVEQEMGSGYVIKQESVLKNNGKRMYGLSIRRDECNIAPIVYLEGDYAEYISGTIELQDVTDRVIASYFIGMQLFAEV